MKHIEELAERLRGTGEPFDYMELTQEECENLDELVLKCDQCGWWIEAYRCTGSGETICDECCPLDLPKENENKIENKFDDDVDELA